MTFVPTRPAPSLKPSSLIPIPPLPPEIAEPLDFLSAEEAYSLEFAAHRAALEVADIVRRRVGPDLLAVARSERFVSVPALAELVRMPSEATPDRAPFWFDRAIAAGDVTEGLAWPTEDCVGLALGKRIWAVLALALHVETMATAPTSAALPPPRLHGPVVHGWRLRIGYALADVLAAGPPSQAAASLAADVATDALCDHVSRLDAELQHAAERHARRFQRAIDRRLPLAELMAVRDALLQAHRDAALLAGGRHPQFRSALAMLGAAERAARVRDTLRGLS